MVKVRSFAITICLLMALTGCRSDALADALRGTATPTAIATIQAPTQTSAPVCAYVWLNRELPEVSQQVLQAFIQAGQPNVTVQAVAYGENCLDTDTNQVISFSAVQTDFYLSIALGEALEAQSMGRAVEAVMTVLSGFPPGKVPGVNLGQATIQFSRGNETRNLTFDLKTAQKAIAEGKKGAPLFEALQTP